MTFKEAWTIYSTKALVNRMKTRAKVSQAYQVVTAWLKPEERAILGEGLVHHFMSGDRNFFNQACSLVEERLRERGLL